jgi:hypothetical protein
MTDTNPRDLIQRLADAYAYCIDEYMTASSEEDALIVEARSYLAATAKSRISEDENERRFRECLRIIQNTTHEDLVKLMGENFLEEFRRASQR